MFQSLALLLQKTYLDDVMLLCYAVQEATPAATCG